MSIKEILKRYHARLVCEGALKAALWGAVTGLSLGCAVMGLSWLSVALPSWPHGGFDGTLFAILGALLLALGAGAGLYYLTYRPTVRQTAARVDALGLAERTVTMVDRAEEDTYVACRQREDGPTLELMIVLDISSSMGNSVTDVASNRLDVAKAGARESVSLLRDTDYVGVVTFDANAQVVMPITPASSREDVIDAIDGIEMGYGTRYGNGLSLAQSCLLGSTNQVDARHVIFITDGKPSDSGYESIIGSMVSQGITVSTVLIYREDGTSATQALKDRVEFMASLGDGRSYLVEAASEFTAIMKEETVLSQKDLLIEGVFFPQAGDYSPVLGNLYQLPPIEGYINVSAKEGATVPFTVDNAPLYAEWQVGKGWVGSYMSDLGGRWSDFFFDYPEGRIFLDNALARLLRPDDPVKTVVQGHNLMAEAFYPEPYLDGHRVTLKVTDPAGYVETVVLTGEADGYRGLFATERTGIYRLDVTHRSSTGEEVYTETGYYAFSYLAEYDTFADPEEGRTLVSDLAERTGGTLLEADGLLFGDGSEDRFVLSDPRTPLLAAAMLLFLADIAIRKFPPRIHRKQTTKNRK